MSDEVFNPIADEGVYTVGRIFTRDFHWAFRPQPVADFGIDAHAEICQDGQPSGKLLFLQIKSGASYFKEKTTEGYVYRGSIKHMEYWLNCPFPVVLLFYEPVSEQVYWQVVSRQTVIPTKARWKLIVPTSQLLSKSALSKFLSLVGIDVDIEPMIIAESGIGDSPSSEIVRSQTIEELQSTYIIATKCQVETLTQAMWSGQLSISTWVYMIAKEIKSAALNQFALAVGGYNAMIPVDFRRLEGFIQQQLRSLVIFAHDISDDRYQKDEVSKIIERSLLHIDSTVVAYYIGQATLGNTEAVYIKTGDEWISKRLGKAH